MTDHIVCEIRCPIHGFIGLNEWEKRLVDHRVFQRLRRIRQLAWTDHVYPSAMHTRFEHSLGVMHVASRLYDSIVSNSAAVLKSVYGYTDLGLARDRQKVRLAALLHDVGHSPFSHGSEELFPEKPADLEGPDAVRRGGLKHFRHEDYSVALVRETLLAAIDAGGTSTTSDPVKRVTRRRISPVASWLSMIKTSSGSRTNLGIGLLLS